MHVNASMQRLCAWAAPACTFFFFIGFLISGYIVPSDPERSAQETANWYAENTDQIRAGLLIMCFAGGLWVIWSAVMAIQMQRIEGRFAVLSLAQVALGVCACIEFIQPVYMWLVAAYRERDPEIAQMLHDMGWLPFDGWIWTIIFQNWLIAIAVLRDHREQPIFPRWYGFYSLFAGFLYLPSATNVFFKDGPLAWNGVISWWVLIIDIFVWLMVTFFLLLKAINRQEAEADVEIGPPPTLEEKNRELERRLVELERRLDSEARV